MVKVAHQELSTLTKRHSRIIGKEYSETKMQSKNKKTPTQAEKAHILRIKEMSCIVCDQTGPSECHELNQGQWFTSIPLCPDCHRGSKNGIHGQKRIWNIKKMDELSALNETIKKLMGEGSQDSLF